MRQAEASDNPVDSQGLTDGQHPSLRDSPSASSPTIAAETSNQQLIEVLNAA